MKSRFIFFSLILLSTLNSGCKKNPPPPAPQVPTPAPQSAKISLPISQLAGLTLNGVPVEEVGARSADPQSLEAQDLNEFFDLKNIDYSEATLRTIQQQLQSGVPFKYLSVFLGTLPVKYAERCQEKLEGDLCLIEPTSFNCTEAFPQGNWTEDNYLKLCQRLGRLKAYNPLSLAAFFDGDNTLWYQDVSNAGIKRGVESNRIQWAPGKAELLPVFPSPEARVAYTKSKTPYDYYRELYKIVGPLWNYNYAALAFRGLSLKDIQANFEEALNQTYAPVPFGEMQALLKYLHEQDIVTGIVSASPVFGVYPLAEKFYPFIPLDRVEGLDVFLKNPTQPESLPVRLSRLLQQGRLDESGHPQKYRSYQEFLQDYGDWLVIDVDQVINARAGKGAQSRSIARRYAAEQNRESSGEHDRFNIDDMRIVMIGGDNFAHSTDIPAPQGDRIANALEEGNDQGMSEGLSFLENNPAIPGGTDFLFIHRFVRKADGVVQPKKGSMENFQAYFAQQKLLRPDRIGATILQSALTDLEPEGPTGGFLQELPKAPETQNTATPLPLSSPQPVTPSAASPMPHSASPRPSSALIPSPRPTLPVTTPAPMGTPKPQSLSLPPIPPPPSVATPPTAPVTAPALPPAGLP